MIEIAKNVLLFKNTIDDKYWIELIDQVNKKSYPLLYKTRRPHKTMELPYLNNENDSIEAIELRLKFLSISAAPIISYSKKYNVYGFVPKKTFITVSNLEAGKGMIEHKDNHNDSDNFICMFYINDSYLGGEIYFPDLNIYHKPSSGDILVYKSNLVHGVKPVLSGERYSIGYGFAGPNSQVMI